MNIYIDEYLSKKYIEIEKTNFYTYLFGVDTFKADSKYKPVYTVLNQNKQTIAYDKLDLNLLDEIQSQYQYICSPITYVSKYRSAKTAREIYAIVFDLDFKDNATNEELYKSLSTLELRFTLVTNNSAKSGHDDKLILKPTIIVTSGSGIHLYYILDKPIRMFKNIQQSITRFKNEYINRFWNEDITPISQQKLAVTQDFRMVGSYSKSGEKLVRAYIVGDKVSVEQLNRYVNDENQIVTKYESKVSLEEAKELWPEWYEKTIVKGEKNKSTGWDRPHFTCNDSVYYWWLNQIKKKATVGHRYFCLRALVIYAVKCRKLDKDGNDIGITYKQLESDCYDLMNAFDELSTSENNRFTEIDVQAALSNYKPRYYTYSIKNIVLSTGIEIKKNNRRPIPFTRKQNLEFIHMQHKFAKSIGKVTWDEGGRPKGSKNKTYKKRDAVIKFRQENPDANMNQCIKATGISKNTVRKWWNSIAQNN